MLISTFVKEGAQINAETQPPKQVLQSAAGRGQTGSISVLEIGTLNAVGDGMRTDIKLNECAYCHATDGHWVKDCPKKAEDERRGRGDARAGSHDRSRSGSRNSRDGANQGRSNSAERRAADRGRTAYGASVLKGQDTEQWSALKNPADRMSTPRTGGKVFEIMGTGGTPIQKATGS